MGKSKTERKQEKKANMKEAKLKEQELNQKKEETAKEKEHADKVVVNQPEQVPLTIYTGMYMITTLVAAATAMLSMVMLAKPGIYFLEGMIGTGMDDGDIRGTMYQHFSFMINLRIGKGQVYGVYISIAVLVVVTLVLTLIGMLRATKPEKKPMVSIDIIATICALAAIIVFICEGRHLREFMVMDELGGLIASEPIWGVYRILYVLLVCDVAFVIIDMVMSTIALSRWKKTGTTDKIKL